ncbi:MAG: polysaccharide deacetylase family protein, partial [Bilophila sp.]
MGILFCWSSARAAEPIVDGKAILALAHGTNLCALTFDDGPSRHTARLLDILRERGIHATFFVVGSQVRYHPQLIQRIRDEGHEIGNHTNTHVSLRHLSPEAQRSELGSVQAALARLGVTSRFIRPPYGRYDANTIKIAAEQGMGLMLWSVDSMDWMRRVRIENMKTLVGGGQLRGVFLFHDTHAPTVDAMPELLDRLIADGCRFVTVSEFVDSVGKEPGEPKTML